MSDVKYKAMGTWKSKIIRKQGKRAFTKSSPARIYIAVPPEEGWMGGAPEKNGYRGRKG